MSPTMRWALLGVVVLFVVFLGVKSRLSRDPGTKQAREALARAKKEAREANDGPGRARAWREAARIALDELERPGLAAAYARRAERDDPTHDEVIPLLSRTMRSARRHQALTKLLWRRLAEEPLDSPRADRLMQELVAIYEGPLRRPAQAQVLKALWATRTKSG
ncbi:MAG: hypothetical protein H6721_08825 [Sandaracinus sp.]|nr:hypothetical protein [Sandaracinus sp.]MCB9632220.1 hypothetical protein [Sandaracinus sp.]